MNTGGIITAPPIDDLLPLRSSLFFNGECVNLASPSRSCVLMERATGGCIDLHISMQAPNVDSFRRSARQLMRAMGAVVRRRHGGSDEVPVSS